MADEREYKVGYCRPPPEHRFKKGQSGNPKGRKRKRLSDAEIIAKIRDERIPMVLDGRRVLVSPLEAALRKTLHTVLAKGNVRDLERLLCMFNKHGAPSPEDTYEQHQREGDAVVQKLFDYLERTVPDDPEP
ncbi:hypothetical protein H9L14_14080 [Sphingomonas sediminicola]|uniref:DUF5681 domain-containing protein n=1 Tax=Sphingomonas sediminicola TaxID=386874 RepID=A0ABX6T703_9SPHN|nr:DUF5681 domain-containing protein [Sphingomonas sediminicola]QNP45634.1 hypothetical protein H9L14_14080 [Sphingomonas sediminicola]